MPVLCVERRLHTGLGFDGCQCFPWLWPRYDDCRSVSSVSFMMLCLFPRQGLTAAFTCSSWNDRDIMPGVGDSCHGSY